MSSRPSFLPSFLSKQPSYSHLSCWGNKNWGNIFSNWVLELGFSNWVSHWVFPLFFFQLGFRDEFKKVVFWVPFFFSTFGMMVRRWFFGGLGRPERRWCFTLVGKPRGPTRAPGAAGGGFGTGLRGSAGGREGPGMTKMLAQQEKNHFLIDGNG